jgi:hypothetical protein
LTRLRDLQRSHPRELTLVTSVLVGSNAFKKEAILHAKYNSYRVKGEWFNSPDQLIDEVKYDLVNELELSTENTSEELNNQKKPVRIVINLDPETDVKIIEGLQQMQRDGQFKSHTHMVKQLLAVSIPVFKNNPMFSIEAARNLFVPLLKVK